MGRYNEELVAAKALLGAERPARELQGRRLDLATGKVTRGPFPTRSDSSRS